MTDNAMYSLIFPEKHLQGQAQTFYLYKWTTVKPLI